MQNCDVLNYDKNIVKISKRFSMLEKSDLKAIKEIVNERAEKTETYLKDYVGFEIQQSERRLESRMDMVDTRFDKIEDDIGEIKGDISEINRNINDMIKTDQQFLEIFGGHEKRIQKLEIVTKKC